MGYSNKYALGEFEASRFGFELKWVEEENGRDLMSKLTEGDQMSALIPYIQKQCLGKEDLTGAHSGRTGARALIQFSVSNPGCSKLIRIK